MNPDTIVALAGVFIALASGYAGWVARILRGESAAKKVDAVAADLDATKKELAEFKVHVAANYASNSTLEQMENRLIDAINRLGERLDRVLERRPARG